MEPRKRHTITVRNKEDVTESQCNDWKMMKPRSEVDVLVPDYTSPVVKDQIVDMLKTDPSVFILGFPYPKPDPSGLIPDPSGLIPNPSSPIPNPSRPIPDPSSSEPDRSRPIPDPSPKPTEGSDLLYYITLGAIVGVVAMSVMRVSTEEVKKSAIGFLEFLKESHKHFKEVAEIAIDVSEKVVRTIDVVDALKKSIE